MNRTCLSLVLSVALLLGLMSAMFVPATAAQTDIAVGNGDCKSDGKLNMADATMLINYISGKYALSAEQKQAADVVADGNVDVYDAARVFSVVNGNIKEEVGGVADVRTSTYATIEVESHTYTDFIEQGAIVEFALTAKGLKNVAGVEMQLAYDALALRYVGADSCVSGMQFNFYAAPLSSSSTNGALNITWINTNGLTVPDDTMIAVLRFEATKEIVRETSLSFAKCVAASTQAIADLYTEVSVGIDGGITVDRTLETTTTVNSDAYVTYTIETVEHEGAIAAGETVELDITMSAVDDVNGLQLYLCYDNTKWQWVSGAYTDALKPFMYKVINTKPNQPLTDKGEVWLTAMDTARRSLADDTVIATVTLKALCDITQDEQIGACHAQVSSYDGTMNGYRPTAAWVDGGVKILAPQTPIVFTVVSSQDAICTDDAFAVDIVMDSQTGISALDMTVAFDSTMLTPVAQNGSWVQWNNDVLGEAQVSSAYTADNPDAVRLTYAGSNGNSAVSGVVATVYFKLNTACLTEDDTSVSSVISLIADAVMFKDDADDDVASRKVTLNADTVTAYHALTLEYYDSNGVLTETFVVPNQGTQTVLPEPSKAPAELNYSFLGWETEVEGDTIRQMPKFGYIVEVENSTIDEAFVGDRWVEEGTKAYFNQPSGQNNLLGYDSYASVKANDTTDGQVFAYWQDEYKNIVSYETIYNFYVPGNLKLSAVYADKAPEQVPTGAMQIVRGVYNPNEANGSITWICALNRGDFAKYGVVECGVIYGPDADYETLCNEVAGSAKRVSVDEVSAESAQYAVTVKGVKDGATRSAVAYAVYVDRASGERITVYSENLLTLEMTNDL